MSRGPRMLSDIGVYHIVFRGVNKQNIFQDDFDYTVMIDYLKDVKKKFPYEIYAYCLMSNHVHLLIKEKNLGDISIIMKKILVKYAMYFNNKYDRSGHLFESRYKSKPINSEEYLFASLRYIHQNPVKALLVDKVDMYMWSSYKEYINNKDGLADKEEILNIINLSQFKRMHNEITEEFDPFNAKKQKLIELKRDIINNYGLQPDEVASQPIKEKRRIIAELLKKYSSGNIAEVTGIRRCSVSYYGEQ